MGVYFSQTSVIWFFLGFSCCPFYRGVRYSEVSARRELTVIIIAKIIIIITSNNDLICCDRIDHYIKFD